MALERILTEPSTRLRGPCSLAKRSFPTLSCGGGSLSPRERTQLADASVRLGPKLRFQYGLLFDKFVGGSLRAKLIFPVNDCVNNANRLKVSSILTSVCITAS